MPALVGWLYFGDHQRNIGYRPTTLEIASWNDHAIETPVCWVNPIRENFHVKSDGYRREKPPGL